MNKSLLIAGWGELPEAMSKLSVALGDQAFMESALSFFPVDFSGDENSTLLSPVQSLVDKLKSLGPEPVSIFGWSLGGMLAIELAANHPELVTELVLLSPTASFVNQESYDIRSCWSFGVELESLLNFIENIEQNPERTLLGTYRSAGHRQDSTYALSVIKNFQSRFASGLEYLKKTDLRDKLSKISVPTLVFHGVQDRTIPWQAGSAVAENIPGAIFCPFSNLGHALPKIAYEPIARAVKLWRDVRSGAGREVSRCASYESEAIPQARIAQELLQMLPVGFAPRTFMDLGCGTGKLGRLVQNRYPQASSIFLDSDLSALSYLSLNIGASNLGVLNSANSKASTSIVCSAAHDFTFGKEVDLVVSSSALQWMDQYDRLFSELASSLSSSGLVAFSLMIDGSLSGLRDLRSKLFPTKIPARSFPSSEQVLLAAKSSGLEVIESKTGVVTEYFEGAIQMFSWLSRLGFNRSNYGKVSMSVPAASTERVSSSSFAGEGSKRLSRKELAILSEHYNSQYSDSRGCPLEFRVLWLIAAKSDK